MDWKVADKSQNFGGRSTLLITVCLIVKVPLSDHLEKDIFRCLVLPWVDKSRTRTLRVLFYRNSRKSGPLLSTRVLGTKYMSFDGSIVRSIPSCLYIVESHSSGTSGWSKITTPSFTFYLFRLLDGSQCVELDLDIHLGFGGGRRRTTLRTREMVIALCVEFIRSHYCCIHTQSLLLLVRFVPFWVSIFGVLSPEVSSGSIMSSDRLFLMSHGYINLWCKNGINVRSQRRS